MSSELNRIGLAEKSFKTVMDADVHQDNKDGRILSAMAFMTAAAAAIFAKAYTPSINSDELNKILSTALSTYLDQTKIVNVVDDVVINLGKSGVKVFGIDISLIAFFFYILLVVLGFSLYLAALGPTLNLPDWFSNKKDSQEGDKIKSLLFFNAIAPLKEDIWKNYWQNTVEVDLQDAMTVNFINETLLIAQKTRVKFALMELGSFFFKGSLICLSILIASLFSFDPRIVWLVAWISVSLLFFMFYIETNKKAFGKSPIRLHWMIFSIVALIIAFGGLFFL
jgi:hypothetical protein